MVQFQRNSVYRYDDSKKSEAEKSETEWMEKEKIKIQDGGRKSSLKSTPPRSQSSLHVHFPPESTMISVTMIPPPPEKMTALRSLKKVLFCCCSAGGAVEGGVEGGEEGENAAAATS